MRALTRASDSARPLTRVYLPVAPAAVTSSWWNAWGIRGAFNHNWDPYWSTSLLGSYASVRYNGNALDITSAKGRSGAPTTTLARRVRRDYSCNPDFNVAQVGVVTRWIPSRT